MPILFLLPRLPFRCRAATAATASRRQQRREAATPRPSKSDLKKKRVPESPTALNTTTSFGHPSGHRIGGRASSRVPVARLRVRGKSADFVQLPDDDTNEVKAYKNCLNGTKYSKFV